MTQPIKFHLLHHKERKWAEYMLKYSDLATLVRGSLATAHIDSLPGQNSTVRFAELPESIRRLLFFAQPDLLVCMDDGVKPVQPIFALDVTEHVAARDHWIQRFPNLVGAAQEGVPGAFVAPRDMPDRAGFPGKTDPFFFYAYDRVVEIHQTPMFIAEWTSTDGQNLDSDAHFGGLPPHASPDIAKLLTFFNLVLDSAVKGRPFGELMRDRLIVDLRDQLRGIAYQSVPKIADFRRLTENLTAGQPWSHQELDDWVTSLGLRLPADLPDRVAKRNKNIVLRPMLRGSGTAATRRRSLKARIKEKGGDPYTQQPLVMDYLFCRLGPTPLERDANLVIDLTDLKFSDFAEYVKKTWSESPLQYTDIRKLKGKVPVYSLHLGDGLAQVMKNFIRIYAFAADVIVFEDGVIYF